MAGQKISLERGSRGPALVTVVNSSRVYADIKRDIEAARLTGIFRTLCCLLKLYCQAQPQLQLQLWLRLVLVYIPPKPPTHPSRQVPVPAQISNLI